MTIKQLTTAPTEADLEAEIHSALHKVFPWIPDGSIRHQTKFFFAFGKAKIDVDGAVVSRGEGRSDILLYWGDKPLAVLELKRKGMPIKPADIEQGLSYASVIRPRFPLVVVTNGEDVRVLEAHSGKPWKPDSASESDFLALIKAATQAAGLSVKEAVGTLMGSNPAIWMQAIRGASTHVTDEMSGAWDDPLQPFVRNFLMPRKATAATYSALRDGLRFIIIDGVPLVGKSSVLRELSLRSAADMAVLYVSAGEGNGVFQRIADILTSALAWPVSADEARVWLVRLSKAKGPALVLALDGLGPEDEKSRRELEDLSSSTFGRNLKIVVAVDDAVVDKLMMHPSGRQASAIGRRVDAQISLGLLGDDEFEKAAEVLWDRRLAIMHGGHFAAELRVPWIIRALGAQYVPRDGEVPANWAAVLPAQLGLDLVGHTRERFADEELRRLLRDVAKGVVADAEDRRRPIGLMLQSLATFVVRRKTLRQFLEVDEIASLVTRGYLKPILHDSGEAVLFVRLPELLASEAANVLASELEVRARKDPREAAKWLASLSSRLPLGDIIAAHSFVDAAGRSGVPLNLIAALVDSPPESVPINPGTKAVLHMPGVGMVDVTFQADGSLLAEIDGRRQVIARDPDSDDQSLMSNLQPWLILSHLAGQRMAFERDGKMQRVDYSLLVEVGTCPHLLRRPDTDFEGPGVPTHEIPGYGEVVCHAAGIVEPITLSLFKMLSSEAEAAEGWLRAAVERNSLAMLCRLDIALREIAKLGDAAKRDWAKRMLDQLIAPTLKEALNCSLAEPGGAGSA
jgi:hypothetical protein